MTAAMGHLPETITQRTVGELKVGYLIQDFPPEVGAGPARALEMSRYWQSRGAAVTIITAMPNRRLPGRGDGQIDGKYRGRLFLSEEWEGIHTMRSWLYASQRRGLAHTVINNATFMVSSMANALVHRPDIDVLVASSPPFLPLLSAVGISASLGVPLVIELRDLWPDYLQQMGILRSRLAIGALLSLERWLLARAEHVVVVTESFRRRVSHKGVSLQRIELIPNGVDLSAYHASGEEAPTQALRRTPGEFIVGYLGTFGRGQGLHLVAEAAALVAKTDPTIRFVCAGDGPEKAAFVAAVDKLGLSNVSVDPPVLRAQTRAFYNSCDACLVPLAPIPIFQETIPSKIFEIMACERPVIASVSGEGANIMATSGAGICVPPGEVAALADAVIRMKRTPAERRREMGAKGRSYVAKFYDRHALAERYLTLLESLASRS